MKGVSREFESVCTLRLRVRFYWYEYEYVPVLLVLVLLPIVFDDDGERARKAMPRGARYVVFF